jgi:hypothetical protein
LEKRFALALDKPRIFSPFGLGVLDLAVGDLVLEAARSAGDAGAVSQLLQQFCPMVNNMEDDSTARTAVIDAEPSIAKTSHPEHRQSAANRSAVWSCNEWDQLEEVIIGNPLNARFPTA